MESSSAAWKDSTVFTGSLDAAGAAADEAVVVVDLWDFAATGPEAHKASATGKAIRQKALVIGEVLGL
jgi:hypothetical protein